MHDKGDHLSIGFSNFPCFEYMSMRPNSHLYHLLLANQDKFSLDAKYKCNHHSQPLGGPPLQLELQHINIKMELTGFLLISHIHVTLLTFDSIKD